MKQGTARNPKGRGFFITIDISIGLIVLFAAIALAFYLFSIPYKNSSNSLLLRTYLQDSASIMQQKGYLGAPLNFSSKTDTRGIREVLRNTPDSVCMQVAAYKLDPLAGPEGYYTLDSLDCGKTPNETRDSSGSENHGFVFTVDCSSGFGCNELYCAGTLSSGAMTTSSSCPSGNCYRFNRLSFMEYSYSASYIVVNDTDASMNASDFTLSAWVMTENDYVFIDTNRNTSLAPVIMESGGGTNCPAFSLGRNCSAVGNISAAPSFTVCDSSGNANKICDPNPLPPPYLGGNWQHLAATFSNKTKLMSLYRNGQLVNSTTLVSTFSIAQQPGMVIGCHNCWVDNLKTAFMGYMDEVRIYNRTLTSTEIENLYADSSRYTSTTFGPNLQYVVNKDQCQYTGGDQQALTFPFSYVKNQDENEYYLAVMRAWSKGVR